MSSLALVGASGHRSFAAECRHLARSFCPHENPRLRFAERLHFSLQNFRWTRGSKHSLLARTLRHKILCNEADPTLPPKVTLTMLPLVVHQCQPPKNFGTRSTFTNEHSMLTAGQKTHVFSNLNPVQRSAKEMALGCVNAGGEITQPKARPTEV